MKFKYKLIFWDSWGRNTVIYFRYKKEAQEYKNALPYYQQEEAMIIKEQ